MPPPDPSLPANTFALILRLGERGRTPILIGGVALVIRGSDRVTVDTDFIVDDLPRTLEAAYGIGFRVITTDAQGRIESIPRVETAVTGLALEKRRFFRLRHADSLEICDVWVDDPASYEAMAQRAEKIRLDGGDVLVASVDDLIQMKEDAAAERRESRDRDDLEFLRRLKG